MIRILKNLKGQINIVSLDIGARGGAKSDLEDIDGLVDFVGFEPDEEAYRKLLQSPKKGWKSETYINSAIGGETGSFKLYITSQPGCSSKLRPRPDQAKIFGRSDYYNVEQTIEVNCDTLDSLVRKGTIPSPHAIKIDIQGMELEVFQGAKHTIQSSSLLVRSEVNFRGMYEDMPHFSELEMCLRKYNFEVLGFVERHDWRRDTHVKYPRIADTPTPYSRGQLIHGDVVFAKSPEYVADHSSSPEALIRLALLLSCYGYFDTAWAAAELTKKQYGISRSRDIVKLVESWSKSRSNPMARVARFRDAIWRARPW
jgi:FkbM family methyltransferase